MNLYTVVTNDEYEHPVSKEMQISGVAEFLGLKVDTAFKRVYNTPAKAKYKIIKTGEKQSGKKSYNREYGRRYRMEHDRREYFRGRAEKMSNLDLLIAYALQFPPGTLLKLTSDYPNDAPHEVCGVYINCGTHYLQFTDGGRVCAEREDLIRRVE